MAEITIPVRILLLKDSIGELLSALSNLKVDSSSFKLINKYILSMTLEMTKFEALTSKSFTNLSQFNRANKSIEKMEDTLAKARIAMNDIAFPEIKLSNEQLGQWDNLTKTLELAELKLEAVKNKVKQDIISNTDIASLFLGMDPQYAEKSYDLLFNLIDSKNLQLQRKMAENKEKLADLNERKDTAKNYFDNLKRYGFSADSIGEKAFNRFFENNPRGGVSYKSGYKNEFISYLKDNMFPFLNDKEMEGLRNLSANELIKNIQEGKSNPISAGMDRNFFSEYDSLEKKTTELEALSARVQAARDKFVQASSTGDKLLAAGEVGLALNEYEKKAEEVTLGLEHLLQTAVRAFLNGSMSSGIEKGNSALTLFKDTLSSTNAEFLKYERALRTFTNMKYTIGNFMGFYQVLNLGKRAIKDAISNIKELDSVMNKIAVVTDMSTSDLWNLMDSYSEMASKYGVTIKGAYEVSQIYYQQGLKTNDVMTLTEETLKLSKVSGLDYATTTDYMTTALRGFKMEMSEASTVVDVYSALAAHTAVSLDELAIGMSKTASSMESVGSTFLETSAMIGTMVAVTRESATNIGSAMKSIASRYGELTKDPSKLVDPDGEVMAFNKVDSALQSVGISMKTTDGQFRNFTDVIVELGEKWETLDSTQQRYIATQFAGNRQQSRFLALVSNVDMLKSNIDVAMNSEDTGTLLTLKTMDSLESKMNLMKVAYQQFYTTIGAEDVFKGMVDGATQLITTLNNLPKTFGKIPLGALAMVADVITLFKAMGDSIITHVADIWKNVIPNGTNADVSAAGLKSGGSFAEGLAAGFETKFGAVGGKIAGKIRDFTDKELKTTEAEQKAITVELSPIILELLSSLLANAEKAQEEALRDTIITNTIPIELGKETSQLETNLPIIEQPIKATVEVDKESAEKAGTLITETVQGVVDLSKGGIDLTSLIEEAKKNLDIALEQQRIAELNKAKEVAEVEERFKFAKEAAELGIYTEESLNAEYKALTKRLSELGNLNKELIARDKQLDAERNTLLANKSKTNGDFNQRENEVEHEAYLLLLKTTELTNQLKLPFLSGRQWSKILKERQKAKLAEIEFNKKGKLDEIGKERTEYNADIDNKLNEIEKEKTLNAELREKNYLEIDRLLLLIDSNVEKKPGDTRTTVSEAAALAKLQEEALAAIDTKHAPLLENAQKNVDEAQRTLDSLLQQLGGVTVPVDLEVKSDAVENLTDNILKEATEASEDKPIITSSEIPTKPDTKEKKAIEERALAEATIEAKAKSDALTELVLALTNLDNLMAQKAAEEAKLNKDILAAAGERPTDTTAALSYDETVAALRAEGQERINAQYDEQIAKALEARDAALEKAEAEALATSAALQGARALNLLALESKGAADQAREKAEAEREAAQLQAAELALRLLLAALSAMRASGRTLSRIGSAINMISGSLIDTSTELGEVTLGIASTAAGATKLVGGIMSKDPIAIASGIISVVNGIREAFGAGSLEKLIERAKKETEKLSNTAKEAKSNFNILARGDKLIKELEKKRGESDEDEEAYLNKANDLAEKFPELIGGFDAVGNAVINAAAMENTLADARRKSAEAALEAAEAEKKLRELELKKSALDVNTSLSNLTNGFSAFNDTLNDTASGDVFSAGRLKFETMFELAGMDSKMWTSAFEKAGVDMNQLTTPEMFFAEHGNLVLLAEAMKATNNWGYGLEYLAIGDYLYNKTIDKYGDLDTSSLYGETAESYLNGTKIGEELKSLKEFDIRSLAEDAKDQITTLTNLANSIKTSIKEGRYQDAINSFAELKETTETTTNAFVKLWIDDNEGLVSDLALKLGDLSSVRATDTAAAKKLIAADLAKTFLDDTFIKNNSNLLPLMSNYYLNEWAIGEYKDKAYDDFKDAVDSDMSEYASAFENLWTSVQTLGDELLKEFEEYIGDIGNIRLKDLLDKYGKLEGWDGAKAIFESLIEQNKIQIQKSLKTYAKAIKKSYTTEDGKNLSPQFVSAWEDNIEQIETAHEQTIMRGLMTRAQILNKAGYGVSANEYAKQGLNLLNALKDADQATIEVIAEHGLNTKESINKITDKIKATENKEDDKLLPLLEMISLSLVESIGLSVDSMIDDFASGWSDKSKTLSNLTSGIDIKDVDSIISLSKGKISFKDFTTNAGKLVLANDKAEDYWDFVLLNEKDKIDAYLLTYDAAKNGLTLNNKYTIDQLKTAKTFNESGYEQLETIGVEVKKYFDEEVDERGKKSYKRKADITDEIFEKAIEDAINTSETKLQNADELLNMAFESIRYLALWNKGDYSSIKSIYESQGLGDTYELRLKQLAGGAKWKQWELNLPDIENAINTMTGGYANLLSDILEKGTENINVNKYKGIMSSDVNRILTQLINDMDASDFIALYYLVAGWTIEEANSKIIEANKKNREQYADELKGLEEISTPGELVNLTKTVKLISKLYSKNLKAKLSELKLARHNREDQDTINTILKELSNLEANNPLSLLSEALAGVGAILDESGLLTATESFNKLAVAEILANYANTIGDGMGAELLDFVSNVRKEYSEAINKGIKGELTNAEAESLATLARALGVNLSRPGSFITTANGLLLSDISSILLYNAMMSVDALQALQIYNSIKSSLKENNKEYKSTNAILGHIGELQERINNITDDTLESHKELKKLLEAERDLAKLITFDEYAGNQGDWNFSDDGNISDSFNNILDYYSAWSSYQALMESWKTSGLVNTSSFVDLLAHVSLVAQKTGKDIQFLGLTFDKSGLINGMTIDNLLSTLVSAVRSDKKGNTFLDTKILSQLGWNMLAGAKAIADIYGDLDAYWQPTFELAEEWNNFANSMNAVERAMNKAGKTTGDFFDTDENGNSIFNPKKFNNFIDSTDGLRETWDSFANSFEIDGTRLSEIVGKNSTAFDKGSKNAIRYSKTMTGIIQMLQTSDGWDTNDLLGSLANLMLRFGIEGSKTIAGKEIFGADGRVIIRMEGETEWVDEHGESHPGSAQEVVNLLNESSARKFLKAVENYGNQGSSSENEYTMVLEGDKIKVLFTEDGVKITGPNGEDLGSNIDKVISDYIDKYGNGRTPQEYLTDWGLDLGLDSTGKSIFDALTGKSGELIGKDLSSGIAQGMIDLATNLEGESLKLPVEIELQDNLESIQSKMPEGVKLKVELDIDDSKKQKKLPESSKVELAPTTSELNIGIMLQLSLASNIPKTEPRPLNEIFDIPAGELGKTLEFTTKQLILLEVIPDKATSELPETLTLEIKLEVIKDETTESEEEKVVTIHTEEEGSAEALANIDAVHDGSAVVNVSSSGVSEVQGEIDSIHGKSVTISVSTTGKIGGALSMFNGLNNAYGNVGLAHAKSTLMGELGPEMVVSNGRYFVVGQNGPEFVDLAEDAIVFNHLLTRSLLEKGTSSSRGKAITNEQKAVAYAHGSIHGGHAHAIPTIVSPPNNGAGLASTILGGIQSGAAAVEEALDAFIKKLDEWYNQLQEIAKIEEKITYQEALRSKIDSDLTKNGKAYYESQKKTINDLERDIVENQALVMLQLDYLKKRVQTLNSENSPWSKLYTIDSEGLVKYKEGMKEMFGEKFGATDANKPNYTPQEQYNWLMSLGFGEFLKYDSSGKEIEFTDKEGKENQAAYKTAVESFWKTMEDQLGEIQDLKDSIDEHLKAVLEAQQKQNELIAEMRDNLLDLEGKVLNAIVESREREIDEMQKTRDVYADYSDKMINGLSDALNKEREMYEMQDDQAETDRMRRRLAILQSSGGSASEIIDLQELIRLRDRDMYFEEQLRQIDAIKLASDLEIERMDAQIELLKELLEYLKAHGLLWEQVYLVMALTPSEITNFIALNTADFWAKSPAGSAKELDDLLFASDKWAKYREEMSNEVETPLKKIMESILTNDGKKEWENFVAALNLTYGKDFTNDTELFNAYLAKYKETSDPNQAAAAAKAILEARGTKTAAQEAAEAAAAAANTGGGGNSGGANNGNSKSNYYAFTTTDERGYTTSLGGTVYASSAEEARAKAAAAAEAMGRRLDTTTLLRNNLVSAAARLAAENEKKKNSKSKVMGNAFAKGTLLGELGPEAWIANGKFHIAGQYGAEMVDLPDDAIVFNHLQTARLLQTGKAGRGNTINGEDAALGNKERNSYISTFWDLVARNRASMEGINYPSYATSSSLEHISNELQNNNTNEAITIEHAEVNMNVEQLANDYDAKRAGELALQEMLRIARKGSVTTVRR